jgi:hypothetical protein
MILPSFRASQVGTVPGPELPCWVVAGPTQSGPYTLELGMGLLVDRLASSSWPRRCREGWGTRSMGEDFNKSSIFQRLG